MLMLTAYILHFFLQGCELDSWGLSHNAAAAPPISPVASCSGNYTSIKLLPFGATNLRMAEMPTTEK